MLIKAIIYFFFYKIFLIDNSLYEKNVNSRILIELDVQLFTSEELAKHAL